MHSALTSFFMSAQACVVNCSMFWQDNTALAFLQQFHISLERCDFRNQNLHNFGGACMHDLLTGDSYGQLRMQAHWTVGPLVFGQRLISVLEHKPARLFADVGKLYWQNRPAATAIRQLGVLLLFRW